MSATSERTLPTAAKTEAASTIVLALGSPLRGDDGVGAAVLQSLAESGAVPPDVRLQDGGTPGLDIALLLQGYRRAILIDAADMGLEPGDWRRLGDVPAQMASGHTLHSAGLVEALALGQALGILPEQVTIYGIQPKHIDWTQGLSEPVRQAVPAVCQAILEDIGTAAPSRDPKE